MPLQYQIYNPQSITAISNTSSQRKRNPHLSVGDPSKLSEPSDPSDSAYLFDSTLHKTKKRKLRQSEEKNINQTGTPHDIAYDSARTELYTLSRNFIGWARENNIKYFKMNHQECQNKKRRFYDVFGVLEAAGLSCRKSREMGVWLGRSNDQIRNVEELNQRVIQMRKMLPSLVRELEHLWSQQQWMVQQQSVNQQQQMMQQQQQMRREHAQKIQQAQWMHKMRIHNYPDCQM
eukprot:TRINITY_DN12040_c0_g2_i1.p2 TRINITY_DN12040_c0_g2~~TRINITY_DN12040_c0_g2_i1.p2  ORF type:complete len:233 (-),score=10.26 TRINITY_DN12040_c0_g2_i1:337-1035(-)